MRTTVRYIIWAILFATVLGVYYAHAAPCTKPIPYRIGDLDTEFGMNEEDFKSIVASAASVWGQPKGEPLFAYDPEARMTVNLIFDTRQMTTLKNKDLESSAQKAKEIADEVKAEYIALEAKYEETKGSYDASYKEFQTAQSAYNESVDYWNSRGGAPKETYNKLVAEKSRLEKLSASLDSKREEVNSLAAKINERIKDYNDLVNEANANIHVINQSADQEFEEGEYVADSEGQRINIYEYTTKDELKRVLAHEFGHALGLEHGDDPDSIMYYLNKSPNLNLTEEDKTALYEVCQVK